MSKKLEALADELVAEVREICIVSDDAFQNVRKGFIKRLEPHFEKKDEITASEVVSAIEDHGVKLSEKLSVVLLEGSKEESEEILNDIRSTMELARTVEDFVLEAERARSE